jgi:hypothetical protein
LSIGQDLFLENRQIHTFFTMLLFPAQKQDMMQIAHTLVKSAKDCNSIEAFAGDKHTRGGS